MRNFFRVATLILLGAAGVYIYEMTGGEIVTAPAPAPETKVAEKPVAVSKSPPARIKSTRIIDRSKPMPHRPPGLERMIEAGGGSDFPVLIPPGYVEDDRKIKQHNLKLHLTDDGYTSVMTLGGMDVVIYGTRKAFRKPSVLQAEKDARAAEPVDRTANGAAPVRGDYTMSFEDVDDRRGGSLSFGRYGVDYHIEFYCHGDKEGCVDEAAAGAFLTDIFVTKKKKDKDGPRLRIGIGVQIGGKDDSDGPNQQQRGPKP